MEPLRIHTITARGAGKKRIGRGMGRGKRRDGGPGISVIRNAKPVAEQTTLSGNHPPETQPSEKQDIAELKEKISTLERQIQNFERHIDRVLKSDGLPTVARVDGGKCKGCGMCINICPTGALTLNDIAAIDIHKCAGCGACVTECPFDAISI